MTTVNATPIPMSTLAATVGAKMVSDGYPFVRNDNNLSDLTNATTARTNLGLSALAVMAATAVAFTGGTIDGVAIGATTPAAGAFTTLTGSALATGGTTARTLAAMAADFNNVMSFGGAGDGTTDNTAAFAATPGPILLPDGIFYINSSQTGYVGNSIFGGIAGGIIKSLESGVVRLGPRNLTVLTAAPARGAGFSENSSSTSFDADFSKSFFTGLYRISGATTLGQPTTGLYGNIPAAAFYLQYNSTSGWNQSDSAPSGRTSASAFRIRVNNTGQGDLGGFNVVGYCNGTRAGTTNFLASPATSLYTGQNGAGADGVYLDTLELAVTDFGFDCAAVGAVFNMQRTNATGALSVFWAGLRIQNLNMGSGGKPMDAFLSLAGPSRIGIDLSAAALYNLDATTPSYAAVAMNASDRIYGNATNGGSGGFPNATVLGTEWYEYNTTLGHSFVVGSASVFNANANRAFIANSNTPPAANPTGGGYLYVDAGALKYRGSSGTVTTLAAA